MESGGRAKLFYKGRAGDKRRGEKREEEKERRRGGDGGREERDREVR